MPVLRVDAELVLEVGERVLEHAEASGDYHRRRFNPPLSISIHMRLRELPAGAVPLARFVSPISGVAITASLAPMSMRFSVVKRGGGPWGLSTPLPEPWAVGQDAVFCLSYDHVKKRLLALSPRLAGDVVERCDLGFLEADLRPEVDPTPQPYVERVAVYIHVRFFSPEEVAHIHEILIEPPKIEEL